MPVTPRHPLLCVSDRLQKRCAAGLLAALLGLASLGAAAQPALQNLPPEVDALLARARVPRDALAAIVVDAAPAMNGRSAPLLAWRAGASVNPASVMKLVTTYAGLELLGPSYTWNTPVYVDGPIRDGVLQGNLIIQGRGDPKLVIERLWLLLRRVKGLGITSISGDIVLDRSAFAASTTNPAEFDNEPFRPYNVTPDALLINYKSVVMTFAPNPGAGVAHISFDPPLANVQMQATVPLAAGTGASLSACGDYRGALKADFSDPFRIAFAGSYPAGCGEKLWAVAYADPASYAERAVQGLWQDMGGTLKGRVREGRAPAGLRPAFEAVSPTLAEVIRDINKFSNNVMAQQLFLTLSLNPGGLTGLRTNETGNGAGSLAPASKEASREVVRAWWQQRFGAQDLPVLDNGSGLSRQERLTPQGLARLLQTAYVSGAMPELMASLPITGVDGTLRNSRSRVSQGWAHLKSGSLVDTTALAGYVHTPSGRRLVVVAIVNHPNAPAARPALDALVDWAVKEGSR
ncbi:D-alanyl-D-alanine carboxypeptidase/D-alanyl-D-alanine-endopeptidase [Polaromonas sp.]|jgi:D-alanyl-D-alanine carboxypeptidase/D-alanyl-D-alanine-endopeptidase (penicillin-binding protein 4)|uniref:D-alanyl-D-alanine carboxypeptidase/D-alanyl-D-alanine endopeptidase n=1 Tax=Polaromonas sp. TaxID=1869339 RepID=UPI002B6C57F6|nr:D-alanyl-D-alanine carboxypeptidase/D-alanyl-D-alanine-endopeptidase [Polaromonas sp.]HQS31650.1 D-alanyl-D-alanine carboxypeptidase/D-alanyl-D-alanine-endopeptidase [Polaromonas sp.]HQS92196.1 D-alanyl-D-alanine carboxypeptidase/D-alanyl-D-alanine-endopeptidase [Polaromonas sp.]